MNSRRLLILLQWTPSSVDRRHSTPPRRPWDSRQRLDHWRRSSGRDRHGGNNYPGKGQVASRARAQRRRDALIIDVADRPLKQRGTERRRGIEAARKPGRRGSARLNSRAMFERGLKRHSYQLWEVKFQCPAKESAAETDQRLSNQLARYILPSRGPS